MPTTRAIENIVDTILKLRDTKRSKARYKAVASDEDVDDEQEKHSSEMEEEKVESQHEESDEPTFGLNWGLAEQKAAL